MVADHDDRIIIQTYQNTMSEEQELIRQYQQGEITYKEFTEAMEALHEDRNNQ